MILIRRMRRKWSLRFHLAWQGLTGKAPQRLPVGVRFSVNGLPMVEADSDELHLIAKWGGADENEWRDLLNGMGMECRTADGTHLSLAVRWFRG